jgi:hypothetical protein
MFFSSGLRMRALSDQEEKTAMSQKMLEMESQLVPLTIFGRALGDIVLGAD